MKKIIFAIASAALLGTYMLPMAFHEQAVRVCMSQVSGTGSFYVGLNWLPVTHWVCKTKSKVATDYVDLGWFPNAAPKDK
jgi:hypothetical protein